METHAIQIGHSNVSYPYFLKVVRTGRRAFTTHPFGVIRHLTCDKLTCKLFTIYDRPFHKGQYPIIFSFAVVLF